MAASSRPDTLRTHRDAGAIRPQKRSARTRATSSAHTVSAGRAACCAHTTDADATAAALIRGSRAHTHQPHCWNRSHRTWLQRARATADARSKASRAVAWGGALTKSVYLDRVEKVAKAPATIRRTRPTRSRSGRCRWRTCEAREPRTFALDLHAAGRPTGA